MNRLSSSANLQGGGSIFTKIKNVLGNTFTNKYVLYALFIVVVLVSIYFIYTDYILNNLQ
jgi:hypothetical protein